jgi:hypothetical protein
MGMLLLSSNSHEICCCYYWAISVISGIDIFYKIINCFSFLKLIINYFSLPAFGSGAAVPAVRGESGSESDGYLSFHILLAPINMQVKFRSKCVIKSYLLNVDRSCKIGT